MMWLFFAIGSAFFAGLTAILAKCGIRRADSDAATAIRTVVVFVFAWLLVFLTGAQRGLGEVDGRTLLFLVLSGLATGASWLFYFHALQKGDVNKVAPIDKSSTVLTILLALLFLGEGLTWGKALCAALIGAGTLLMVGRGKTASGKNFAERKNFRQHEWLVCAVLSAFFASLTAILGKIGIAGIDSNLGTAIRTSVVLLMAWLMVLVAGKRRAVRQIERRELLFILLSGLATGASWLCYYRALQDGPASVVAPVDKLSLLVTVAFSALVFHERLSRRAALGLCCMTAGTVVLAMM